ncbi:restriction endonuclease subunit S [Mariprofundus erugo]|uniref:restriction endonuclease subunit S n=1 Tax=Mariprofundus erugo TaxID=2528639 RepID=UPI001930E6F6|nr:restriction endonuclease subunit S [Mariprofundus erugo]
MRLFPFSAVCSDVTSKFRKIKASEYNTEGRFKIIDQGQKEVAGYTDDESLINTTHTPIIIFGDHTRALKYEESPVALGADGAKALSVNPTLANAHYVYYYLRTINLKAAGYSRHFKFLKQVKIPIPEKDGEPDFGTQQRIAHLIGKVEGLIAQRKQHLQQLDDLLKSVFLEMFGDPVRNEKGWDTEPLGKLAKIERGRFSPRPRNDPKFYNGAYPFIQTGDISRSNGRLREFTQTLNELGIKVSKEFDVGTIVIAIVGATIGETAILQIPTYAPDSVIGITPKTGANETESVFIEFLLRFWKPVLRARAPEGARANINIETLRPLSIIWPLKGDREKFAVIVEKVEGIKSRYQQSLTDLENLYGALSQKAFKGELDLSRISLDGDK